MTRAARVARYVALFCIAGIALIAYFFAGSGGAVSFWVMLALFLGLCICAPVLMMDDFLENIGWKKRASREQRDDR